MQTNFMMSEADFEKNENDYDLSDSVRAKAIAIVKRSKMLSEDRVDFEDAVNLVLILFRSGNLDLNSKQEFEDECIFGVEKVTKKISQLVLQKRSQRFGCFYFPAEMISSLDELKDLKLANVNIAPYNINELSTNTVPPNGDSKSPSNSTQRPLHNLKNLDVSFLKMHDKGTMMETRIFHLLPKLESVTFRIFSSRTQKAYFRNILNSIGSSFCACQKTLRSIGLSYSMLTETELNLLLVSVVPKLPNLVHINISANKIESMQNVARCIITNRNVTNDSLKTLDLSWNPVLFQMKNDPQEKEALMIILHRFKGIHNLGNDINLLDYQPATKYQLLINHAGRRLIEKSSLCNKTMTKSLMPYLLERAYRKSPEIYPSCWQSNIAKDSTGIYYLLHSEPILHGLLRRREAGNEFIRPSRTKNGNIDTRHNKRRKDNLS